MENNTPPEDFISRETEADEGIEVISEEPEQAEAGC
jgi:hypothetical protein